MNRRITDAGQGKLQRRIRGTEVEALRKQREEVYLDLSSCTAMINNHGETMMRPNPKNSLFNRRDLIKDGLYLTGAMATKRAFAFPAQAPGSPIPVIDTHIHLFDTERPGGVPWPEPSDTTIYKPALPSRYQQVSRSFGVVGAIAIEASPLGKDNDWLLAIAKKNPIVVGVVGDLIPGAPRFAGELERLHRDPLFLGLRYGNLWNRNLASDINLSEFMDGLKLIAETKLVFESANPNPILIRTLADIAERIPDLTIVIDHLPHAIQPTNAAEKVRYKQSLHALGAAPRVFVKLSEIPVEEAGNVPTDMSAYEATLDELWSIFGEDKVLFGSDWPNSDHLLPYSKTIGLLKSYAAGKSRIAQEKLFWRNSIHAYRWQKRLSDQPG